MTATQEKNGIPRFVKWIIFVAFIFMPIFLVLPFFFWGNTDPTITIAEENMIATRTAPVGSVNVASEQQSTAESAPESSTQSDSPSTETAAASFDPQATYDSICAVCHANDMLGAPVFGEAADWQARLDNAGSLDALVQSGITGVAAMPPKGGAAISDEQFHDMVVFMLDHSGVSVQ
ncbi:c-type cytochrome [Suttonella sp. R2A3]|uniref:c-type cytochrome n=1 Tax=Suttonella sp. R2A3 TaxID=2908648 RepID=UPI001F37765D|nr:c-type cytochrome [Suttonella sp. R2A3]UJF24890.1 c-type cytochrome [Suttonella sp. R2A3]